MFAAVVALAGHVPSLWSLRHPGEVRCPPDAAASRRLIDHVRAGKAGVAELTAGGATQVGAIPANRCPYTEYPETFPFSGNGRPPVRRLGARRTTEHVPDVVPCRAGLPAVGEAAPPRRGMAGRP